MPMKLYDGMASHTMAVRLFILERGHLELEVVPIDVAQQEHRRLAYRTNVNERGEVPALQLEDGFVITEIPAICEYLDEVATGGHSLFGSNPIQRAETRMWLRRMDLEIAQPINGWYRNDPDTVDFYQGHRLVVPEARLMQKIQINQALNLLEDQLEGKTWLCGDRFSAADTHFYGLLKLMTMGPCPWVLLPGRENVVAYFKRMDERQASQTSLQPFSTGVYHA